MRRNSYPGPGLAAGQPRVPDQNPNSVAGGNSSDFSQEDREVILNGINEYYKKLCSNT